MDYRSTLISTPLILGLGAIFAHASVIPNDTYIGKQWALFNDGTFRDPDKPLVKAGADLNMPEAWEIQTGDSTIIVGIIDSGCKWKHKEFEGRIWINKKEIAENGLDDDGNGYIDDANGWNFQANNNDITDTRGHGTGMACIIGANGNNGIGYAGMDWKCKLMICKVSDSNGNSNDKIVSMAIRYAVDNGAKVLNLSSGGDSTSSWMKDALDYAQSKNVLVVAAVGNAGINRISYPAFYDYCIAVGATDPDDTRSSKFFGGGGSNYGSQIDVVAPGGYIYELDYLTASEYNHITWGTSSSTAYVTGLASLLLAQDPSRTPADLRKIIQETADDQVGNPLEDTPGWDQYHGHGRINAFRALTYSGAAIRISRNSIRNGHKIGIMNTQGHSIELTRMGLAPTSITWDIRGRALGRNISKP